MAHSSKLAGMSLPKSPAPESPDEDSGRNLDAHHCTQEALTYPKYRHKIAYKSLRKHLQEISIMHTLAPTQTHSGTLTVRQSCTHYTHKGVWTSEHFEKTFHKTDGDLERYL